MRLPLRCRRPLAAAALALAVALPAAPAPALAATDYPAGYTGFHTYAEMVADIHAVQAAHPGIVRLSSIGTSDKGRTLWVAKVSDNVATDEPEPEVLYDGLHHGNEPMGLEMTLRILHWLAEGYGSDSRITTIVDAREVWIVFAVNPDGQAYDYGSGRLRNWRRNRQPTAGTPYVGTDLNRNYGYRWGGPGSSGNPASSRFRGKAPFSAPEARAMRGFLASRVVGGRQQIRASISFHEYGRLVMWPYSHTLANVPADMTDQDHAALLRIGRAMAASNGYVAQQGSDLYVASGTSADYQYGRYRIFAFTIELSKADYPGDSAIPGETGRNKEAVLYLAERAWCPLAVLGTAVRDARCGAFDDDLEVTRGWKVNPDGTDTSPSTARWTRADPARATADGVTLQPSGVPSGRAALVTGSPTGSKPASYDLDGRTTVRSAPIALPVAAGQSLTFRFLWAHRSDATAADHLRVIVEAQDGTRTVVWERTGRRVLLAGAWRAASVPMDAWAGQTIRIRFEARDAATSSTVEAGIDDVRVTRPAG